MIPNGRIHGRSSHGSTRKTKRQTKKKFGYRTKQNKIDVVFNALQTKYINNGKLVSNDVVLRGEDTVRLHVKKYDALDKIQTAICAVEAEPDLEISHVSIPMSMKNKFQKKGFLVYLKMSDASMIEKVKNIFKKFKEFQKCDVARPSNNNKPHHAAVEYNAVAPAEHEPGAVSVHPAFGSSVDASSIESGYEDLGSTAPTGYMPDTNTQERMITEDNTIFTSQNKPVDCSLDNDDLDFDEGENNDFNDLKILPMLHQRSAGAQAGC